MPLGLPPFGAPLHGGVGIDARQLYLEAYGIPEAIANAVDTAWAERSKAPLTLIAEILHDKGMGQLREEMSRAQAEMDDWRNMRVAVNLRYDQLERDMQLEDKLRLLEEQNKALIIQQRETDELYRNEMHVRTELVKLWQEVIGTDVMDERLFGDQDGTAADDAAGGDDGGECNKATPQCDAPRRRQYSKASSRAFTI